MWRVRKRKWAAARASNMKLHSTKLFLDEAKRPENQLLEYYSQISPIAALAHKASG